MLKNPFSKALAVYLVIALFALSFPATGWAMLVPAAAEVRSADLAKVQTALESSVIRQRLLDYGLTAEEATTRVAALSDAQLHQLAANLDAVQAGGDVLGDVIVILLIVVLVIVILELTGHKVVTRR
jgi:hypothetical protein